MATGTATTATPRGSWCSIFSISSLPPIYFSLSHPPFPVTSKFLSGTFVCVRGRFFFWGGGGGGEMKWIFFSIFFLNWILHRVRLWLNINTKTDLFFFFFFSIFFFFFFFIFLLVAGTRSGTNSLWTNGRTFQ